MGLALDFLVQRVSAEGGVVLLELNFLLGKFLVTSGHVTGGVLTFLTGFGALDDNGFAGHGFRCGEGSDLGGERGWSKPENKSGGQIGRPCLALRPCGVRSTPQTLLMARILRALTALMLVHLQTTLFLEASHSLVGGWHLGEGLARSKAETTPKCGYRKTRFQPPTAGLMPA